MPDKSKVWRIGEWRVDRDLNEISREGQTIRLEPRTMRLLLYLAAHAGRVVEVPHLLDGVWPNVVVTQSSVYQAILQLRRILGDDTEHPSYIENVPRRGYRLIAPVISSDAPPAAPEQPALSSVRNAPVAQSPSLEKSIAVLPFTNLSSDKENEYFGDGLAEEILNALSQVENLHVASRGSAFSFKGKAIETGEIAAKLHVANVLEGSVRRSGNRIRVTVQLVDARSGFHLWSERYDRQSEDIFEIQDEIARATTERLKVTLGAGVQRSTKSLEAYELYLEGRHFWHQRSPATVRTAIQCFERVIKLDPEYARAYAGLADCYGILRAWGHMSAEAARPPAHAAMLQASALAPSLWEVQYSRAFYIFYFERVWRQAEPYFKEAITINPRSSLAQVYYGLFLATAGRAEEALAQTMLACELDHLSPVIHGLASNALVMLGRFDAAERAAQHALELQPDFLLGVWPRALALCGLGRYEEAIESLERLLIPSRVTIFVGLLGFAYARAGRVEDARPLLRELENRASRGEYIPAFTPLMIYVGLGDVPGIRTALSRSLSEPTSAFTIGINCGYHLKVFRTDPEIDRMHRELFGW